MAFLGPLGSYLPSRVVTNAEMGRLVGCEPEWIQRTSGIETRRFAAADETVVDLAVAAGSSCLAAAGARTIGFVLVASGSSERRFPGPATRVAHALGLGHVPALDVPVPSAGGLMAMVLASELVRRHGDVLVVAAEKMSTIVQREGTNPQVAVLFGDGAGACLVSDREGPARVVDSAIYSDGAFDEALQLGFGDAMHMDGRTVIMQAARKIPQVITEMLVRHQIETSAVGTFLLHQANQNLTDQVAKTLNAPAERFFSNVRRYGNTSSASMLIAAAEWAGERGFERDVPVVFAAFGAGLQWGALLVTGT